MQLCQLITTRIREDAWHHKCRVCGKEEVLTTEKWHTPCGIHFNASEGPVNASQASTVAVPSLARRAVTLASEAAKWAAAGSPRRSDERIKDIFAICRACPLFSNEGEDGTCRACGCKVSSANRLSNKISMATTRCPVGKWEAEA